MNAFCYWLVENTIVTAILCAVVWVACRWLLGRPAIRHALWLVVLVKFVLPPVIAAPWTAQNIMNLWTRPSEFAAPLNMEPVDSTVRDSVNPNGVLTESWFERLQLAVSGDLALQIILGTWLLGCITVILIQVRRIRRCRAALRHSRVAPGHLTSEIHDLSRAFGMEPIRARVMHGIAAPFIWCYGRSRLMWPESLSSETHIRRSRGLLAHEMAHVYRRDHWTVWLELVAGAIWWWNPVYWFVRRQLREAAEMACDALALNVLPEDRRIYAEMFLEFSSQFEAGVPAPALGINSGSVASFERRLTMILSDCVSGRLSKSGLFAVGLLAVIACPSWTLGQSDDGDEELASVSVDTDADKEVYTVTRDADGNIEIKGVDFTTKSDQFTTKSDQKLKEAVERRLAEFRELTEQQRKKVADAREEVARQKQNALAQHDALAEQREMLAGQKEAFAKQQELLAIQEEAVAKVREKVAAHEEKIAAQHEKIARHIAEERAHMMLEAHEKALAKHRDEERKFMDLRSEEKALMVQREEAKVRMKEWDAEVEKWNQELAAKVQDAPEAPAPPKSIPAPKALHYELVEPGIFKIVTPDEKTAKLLRRKKLSPESLRELEETELRMTKELASLRELLQKLKTEQEEQAVE